MWIVNNNCVIVASSFITCNNSKNNSKLNGTKSYKAMEVARKSVNYQLSNGLQY